MNQSPSISILLPFKDAATTLPECLHSIFQQSEQNFELIGVNDHSTDCSTDLFQQFDDSRIRLLENQGSGLVNALNTGLQSCNSDWIARMDADDIMNPERLRKQLHFLKSRPDTDILGSRVKVISEKPLSDGFQYYIEWLNKQISHEEITNALYTESPLAHPSVVFRKQAVIQAGAYQHGDFPEDYDLWFRLWRAGCRFEKHPDHLLEWRDTPDRLSRTAENCRREAFEQLRARYLSKDARISEHRPLVIWGGGRKSRRRAELLTRYDIHLNAWIDVATNRIGQQIKGTPVYSPDWLKQDQKPFVLSYVTSHGARQEISKFLQKAGYRSGADWLQVGM